MLTAWYGRAIFYPGLELQLFVYLHNRLAASEWDVELLFKVEQVLGEEWSEGDN